ncbi:hypothetical protein [Mucilaginibacter lacusdianchii]|uniref:hypothetical protein n=1 Tax=Mucilaginibacter lacusdianchii TaxID=2684211 RepID=UPI00131B743F|nr:hypothetical protein [Mucilaginibacter sp. JXJ CY 39]
MENNSNRSHFWPSYVDLMTSLFVIMLVLFVLSYLNFNRIETELRANAEQMARIRQIDSALKKLDRRYFRLDPVNNRYQLMIDVNFAPNSADIRTLRADQLRQLREAGQALFGKMQDLAKDPNINYILVVEGHAEIVLWHGKPNSELDPNRGYQLSYSRALALKNFWQQSGYGFNGLHNCEILIVGSGYFGKSRDRSERNNRRFTIQIAPKFKI